MVSAHRLSYLVHKGDIPSGLHVCHTCDNRACINPDHLWLGSNLDNHNDKIRKNRGVVLRGEDNGRAKLSEGRVKEIRIRHFAGESCSSISQSLDVSYVTVWRVIKHATWRCV